MKVKVEKSVDFLTEKFSFSKLQLFAKCPRRAFYKYVARRREVWSEPLLWGKAAHTGQEVDNRAKLKGEKLSISQVHEAAVAGYDDELGKEKDRFAQEHKTHLTLYHTNGERDKIVPEEKSVESRFQVGLEVTHDPDAAKPEPVVVEGFIDVVSIRPDGKRTVVDYKCTGRASTPEEAAQSHQLALYRLGAEAEYSCLVQFIKHLKQRPTVKVTPEAIGNEERFQGLMTFLADTINAFRRCVRSGDWPKCAPICHWCSPTACGNWEVCYPKKDPMLSKFIQVTDLKPVGTLPPVDWRK
jgi:hypothetical protein